MTKKKQYQRVKILLFLFFVNFSYSQDKFIDERDSLCNIKQFIVEKITYITDWELKDLNRDFKRLSSKSFYVKSVSKNVIFETFLIGNKKVYIRHEKNYLFIKYANTTKYISFKTDVKLVFLGYLKRDSNLIEFKFKVILPNCITAISLNNRNKKNQIFNSVVQYDFFPTE